MKVSVICHKKFSSTNAEVPNGLDLSHQFDNGGENNKVNNGYWKNYDNKNDYLKIKGEYNADQNNSRDLLNLESKFEYLSKQS